MAEDVKGECPACWLDIDPACCGSDHCPRRHTTDATAMKARALRLGERTAAANNASTLERLTTLSGEVDRESVVAAIANELGCCDEKVCGNTRRSDDVYVASAELIADRILSLFSPIIEGLKRENERLVAINNSMTTRALESRALAAEGRSWRLERALRPFGLFYEAIMQLGGTSPRPAPLGCGRSPSRTSRKHTTYPSPTLRNRNK